MDKYKLKDGQSKNHFIWEVYNTGYKTGNITREQAGEICNRELGLGFDESAFRKKYESFESMWTEVKDEYLVGTDEELVERLSKIEELEDGLYKTKVKTADKLREYRKTLRDEARIENIVDLISSAVANVQPIKSEKKDIKINGDLSAILQIGDWHYGMVTDNFWNKYNTKIAKERVEKLLHDTIKYCQIMGVSKLYVANLNDLLNGNIHVTTRIQSEEDVLQQTMHVAELLAWFLAELESYGLEVFYSSVTDNHARINSYKEHIEKENFNKIVDWYLKTRLKDTTIDIIENLIDESISLFKVGEKNVFAVHGHLDKPSQVLPNLALGVGVKPDIVLMGHYHNRQEFSIAGCKVVINGSLCGVDDYAKNNRYFSKAVQNLLVIDNENILNIEIVLN
jgi:Icc-related predicted phosphoesterase